MRTKTLALSALLGLIGAASAVAQTNVYSLNAVGYVNVTIPAGALELVTCPLIASPDNTINTLMNNGNGALNATKVTFIIPGETPGFNSDTAAPVGTGKGKTTNTNGWVGNGVLAFTPGVAAWVQAPAANAITLTFVGQVPTGSLTNTIVPGYNLIASAVPVSGDLQSNSITAFTNYNQGDAFYMYDPTAKYANSGIGGTYKIAPSSGKGKGTGYNNNFAPSDAMTFAPTQGFWYFNSKTSPIQWVENFSINP